MRSQSDRGGLRTAGRAVLEGRRGGWGHVLRAEREGQRVRRRHCKYDTAVKPFIVYVFSS